MATTMLGCAICGKVRAECLMKLVPYREGDPMSQRAVCREHRIPKRVRRVGLAESRKSLQGNGRASRRRPK